MIETRILNVAGTDAFMAWLENPDGTTPSPSLVDGDQFTEPFPGYNIDPNVTFVTRYDFGRYLAQQFAGASFNDLMARTSDGLWSWLSVVYFAQLSAKGIRRNEHYIVARKGSAGSLAYRNAARTSFELVRIHGEYARLCLNTSIHTYGDMTEQLASRQTIARNVGFFQAAYSLYFQDEKLKRGARARAKRAKDRKPGDRTGMGAVDRLALALQRLDLTHDTESMSPAGIMAVLPREFAKWHAKT